MIARGRGAPWHLVILALLLAVPAPQPAAAEGSSLTFTPPEWDFGTLQAGSRASVTLHVKNWGAQAATITVLPTCDCLTTGPSRRVVAAGGQADFAFTILAEDDESGNVRENYLILTDVKGLDHFYYPVRGVVKGPSPKPLN